MDIPLCIFFSIQKDCHLFFLTWNIIFFFFLNWNIIPIPWNSLFLKLYKSVAFCLFTRLWSHHHCLVPKHVHPPPERNPLPIFHPLPAPGKLLSIFCLYGMVYSGHVIYVIIQYVFSAVSFFCLAWSPPCVTCTRYFFSWPDNGPLHRCAALFVHSFRWRASGLFPLLALMKNAGMYKLRSTHMFSFLLGRYLGAELLGRMGNLTFWQSVKQFPRQLNRFTFPRAIGTGSSFSTSHQNLLLSVFRILPS